MICQGQLRMWSPNFHSEPQVLISSKARVFRSEPRLAGAAASTESTPQVGTRWIAGASIKAASKFHPDSIPRASRVKHSVLEGNTRVLRTASANSARSGIAGRSKGLPVKWAYLLVLSIGNGEREPSNSTSRGQHVSVNGSSRNGSTAPMSISIGSSCRRAVHQILPNGCLHGDKDRALDWFKKIARQDELKALPGTEPRKKSRRAQFFVVRREELNTVGGEYQHTGSS